VKKGYTEDIRGQQYNTPILELPAVCVVEPDKKISFPIDDYKGLLFDFWCYTNESNGWALHHYAEKV
jgi:hypothetical protein